MTTKLESYTPPPVSKFYVYDWQFAVDIYNATSLRFISLMLLFVPLIIDPGRAALLRVPPGLYLSSVTFIAALVIIYLFCPKFVREYRDFGQYRARYHSHRWIVWEFYNNLKSLLGWREIVRETVSKGISRDINHFTKGKVKTKLQQIFREGDSMEPIYAYKPLNIGRDIYLPISIDGHKIVLSLRENDKQLTEKEKELFWILYTQAVKEKPFTRLVFWVFIYSTVVIFFLSVFFAFSSIAGQ